MAYMGQPPNPERRLGRQPKKPRDAGDAKTRGLGPGQEAAVRTVVDALIFPLCAELKTQVSMEEGQADC